jgi:hypothetical protein
MELKEKYSALLPFYNVNDNNNKSIQCEKIADDYAIEFAEWCVKYRDKNKNINGEMLHSISKYDDTYSTKELLEIFKKLKAL